VVAKSPAYDLELWASFRKGDEASLEKLFNSYYSVLLNYGQKFTHNKFFIEESVQDLFVKLWNNRLSLGETASVKNYLFKAFRSVLFRKLKRQASNVMERLDDERYEFRIELAPDQKIMETENEQEVLKSIQAGLAALTSRQREAIFLRFYEDMSYDQVAEILDMNVGSTYKLIYRALERLKEKMGPVLFSVLLSFLNLNGELLS
jgi:RNA polymerase sigma factor (sigma-70 family)